MLPFKSGGREICILLAQGVQGDGENETTETEQG